MDWTYNTIWFDQIPSSKHIMFSWKDISSLDAAALSYVEYLIVWNHRSKEKVITHGFWDWNESGMGKPNSLSNSSKNRSPRCRAVEPIVRKSAYACAPHSDRKPLVTLRWITDGRKALSQALLVGSTLG